MLTKENIAEPMRDIRRALLEADVSPLHFSSSTHQFILYLHNVSTEVFFSYFHQVSLPVVRRFVSSVSDKALGANAIRGVRPDQQLVKVCLRHTGIKEFADNERLNFCLGESFHLFHFGVLHNLIHLMFLSVISSVFSGGIVNHVSKENTITCTDSLI